MKGDILWKFHCLQLTITFEEWVVEYEIPNPGEKALTKQAGVYNIDDIYTSDDEEDNKCV